ncbi:MAG: response regulator [Candidatus Zhuqueibacterota bacterium]
MTSDPKRILIVDDEEDLTWSIARSLRKENEQYEIMCVNSGEEALEVIRRFSLDLLITDIRMPGIDGLILLDYVKKYHSQMKVIIMTASDSIELRDRLAFPNSVYFIEKPFEIAELKKIIHQAVQKSTDNYKSRLVELNLADIIIRNCQKKFNGNLSISNGTENGVIHFRAGEIIHAQVGTLEGEKALSNVLKWNDGYYDTTLSETPIRKTIHSGWRTLLKKYSSQNIGKFI